MVNKRRHVDAGDPNSGFHHFPESDYFINALEEEPLRLRSVIEPLGVAVLSKSSSKYVFQYPLLIETVHRKLLKHTVH